MLDEERIINFLEKHKIGLHQFFFLHCIYKNKMDVLKRYRDIIPPYENSNKVIHLALLEDLIEKKLIIKEKDEQKNSVRIRVSNEFAAFELDANV